MAQKRVCRSFSVGKGYKMTASLTSPKDGQSEVEVKFEPGFRAAARNSKYPITRIKDLAVEIALEMAASSFRTPPDLLTAKGRSDRVVIITLKQSTQAQT